jgi:ribosomal protein S12 methylthiotransferase accessory factor
MDVGIVGSGPAASAVEAAVADVGASATSIDPEHVAASDCAVVVGDVGAAVFERTNEQAAGTNARWLAVELGGVGGYPVVDAAVVGFAPEGPCYACLAERVAANRDPDAEPVPAPADHTARFAGAVAGRSVARYLADGDEGVFSTVREVDGPRRTLLQVPGCSCATAVDRSVPRTDVDRDLEEALARAERGLDDRVGIVQEVGEAESFPVPYYLARGCDTGGFSDATANRDAAGVAAGWDAAFMKALGEAMERYCAGVYRVEDLQTASPGELDGVVPPSAFVCRGDPETEAPREWVPGENLATGGDVRLPADLVYHPPPGDGLRPAITTGLGLGNGGPGALLTGLYEVIERDAAVLAWYSTFEPLGLEVADDAFDELVGRARSEGLAVTPLLLTQDVDVPVVAACVHREEWPRFAVGTSAHLDAAEAATGALAEALQNWVELRGMGPDRAAEAAGRIGHYAALPDAAVSFMDAATTVPAESVGPAASPAGSAALDRVLDHLADAEMRAYAARLTTPDVAALGFEAVRVLVPAAQPLFFGDPYFGERAESVPASLGYEHDPGRPHHPFP